jgi:hypothetical protein
LVYFSYFPQGQDLYPSWVASGALYSFFELIGDYLLKVVEEVRLLGKVPGNFNYAFIALIPKVECLEIFDGFGLIALCNCIYEIISNVLVVRMTKLLSGFISYE